jgi:acyl-CoA reductase-like NAD-dependent aldehyde dehydrogenase
MQRIMNYIKSGKEQGAKVHSGGERLGTEGYWIQPTIFTDTRPDMRIVQEEIFGPVCAIIKFEDEEDVLRQANDTLYGLAAAVFTKDITRGIQFAHRVNVGTAWVNCVLSVNANVPFGGNKQSGIGRECGQYALDKWVLFSRHHRWSLTFGQISHQLHQREGCPYQPRPTHLRKRAIISEKRRHHPIYSWLFKLPL